MTRDELLALLAPELRAFVDASFVPVAYDFGETVVREGDEADALYVVHAGAARLVKAVPGGDEVPLGVLGTGQVFGEAELLDGGRRMATVRASGPLEVLRLERSVFEALARSNPRLRESGQAARRRLELLAFLRLSSALSALPTDLINTLADDVEEVDVPAGQTLGRHGEDDNQTYLVREGRLVVKRGGQVVGVLRPGDALGGRPRRQADSSRDGVQAVTDCRLLTLDAARVAPMGGRVAPAECLADEEAEALAHVPLDFADVLAAPEPVAAPAPVAVAGPSPEAAPSDDDVEWPDAPVRRWRSFPLVWQLDEMDCGAACLAMVCSAFGARISVNRVREAVGTQLDGTSLRGLVVGAERLGLAAQSVKVSKSRLDRLPLPAICHWEGDHWLVLHRVTRSHVRVADPALGHRRIPRAEWEEKWSGYCAVVAPTPALAEQPASRSPWRWLAPFVRPHRRTLALAAGLALAAAGMQMLLPVGAGLIVDEAVRDGDHRRLHLLAGGMLALLVIAVAATLLRGRMLARLAVRFDTDTLDHLTTKLLDLPLSYFATRRTGDVERRLSGMRQVRLFLVQQGVEGLTAAAQVCAAVVVMLVYSPLLTVAYLVAVPSYAFAMRHSRRRLRPLLASLEDAFGRYQSRQIDAIKGIDAVKSRGAEPFLRRIMRRQFGELSGRVLRADLAFMAYEAAVALIGFVSLVLFLWAGGLLVLEGRLTVGELVAFNGLVLLANAPVLTLMRLWDELQYADVLLGRIDDVLDRDPELPPGLRAVPTLGGHVTVERLSYSSPGPNPVSILEDVSIDMQPGETLALVGRSGAGKTTLVKCLTGLLVPTSGRVLYDGVDLMTLDRRELRARMGFVLQDDHVFDDTIARNIALGDDSPDLDRVRWAAGVAAAADFVERLPLGYDTRVGESGLRVSGGEAQRLCIARAVYRRPAVLVFDEATSSLDADAERAVQEQLDELLSGRTAIVIAHRLSTVRNADRIVVLDRGRIAETGSHTELMERRGIYRHLVAQQLET